VLAFKETVEEDGSTIEYGTVDLATDLSNVRERRCE
jgi:hypothetical protein